jgi:hypothetical protein
MPTVCLTQFHLASLPCYVLVLQPDEIAVAFRISDPSPELRRLVDLSGVENLLPDE